MLLVDSGLEGLMGSVEYCDDCDDQTVHLSVTDGVAVCNQCGDSPAWDDLDDCDD